MTTLQTKSSCQMKDPNNTSPIEMESSLRFPLDGSMHIIFTGYYNGFGVEVRSIDEVTLLYHMGCFGKGSSSRSKPNVVQNSPLMRKRQFVKRISWSKKYGHYKEPIESDLFLKEIDRLAVKVILDSEKHLKKDVIDLVSSDENSYEEDETIQFKNFQDHEKEDIAVIVPNSDSEDDDYFANLKPHCCINKMKLQEKLMLTTQESFFLLYGLGCLQIFNKDNNALSVETCWELFAKSDEYFLEKYVVYHYFRSKGYIVKPGIKFGGDYLLYKEGPEINHAEFIILIRYGEDKYDWISMFGHIRVASTTVKEIMVVEIVKPNREIIKLPEDLGSYCVREIKVSRNIPVKINNDNELI